jgi:hypothetical protein
METINNYKNTQWHGSYDFQSHFSKENVYRFNMYQQPYMQQLIQRLIKKGIIELQAADTDYGDESSEKPKQKLYADFFEKFYDPDVDLVLKPYPVKDLDFSDRGAYSVYNWELFFHVPFTIAIHLSKNQRFAESQQWFHYVFNPTDDSEGETPQRFWKVHPFHEIDVQKIQELLKSLANGEDASLIHSIEAWREAPFRPHVIARYRQQAYMYKTVMAYLDNLIAWGDSLYRQDTGEAVDEALMLYVLAANILGKRPQLIPQKGTVRCQTYDNIRTHIKKFGTVIEDIESDIPFDIAPPPNSDTSEDTKLETLRSLGKSLYFCVPGNDKLLSYWDTVSDRLFKIRNSLNLQGTFRQLALYEPPIDPAMLVRAAANGLDVSAIVNGLNQPLPLVRFQLLVQKAFEIVQEVKALGNSLLSAMEKEDNETLAILRAKHERVVMEMVEQVKYGQLQESIKSREGLLQSLALAVQRYTFYEMQLGKQANEIEKSIPEIDELDKDSLARMKIAMQEPEMALREIEVDIATDVFAKAAQSLNGGKILSSHEVRESTLLEEAQFISDYANMMNIASSVTHAIPIIKILAAPVGVGEETEAPDIGKVFDSLAAAARSVADRFNFEARRASRTDSFARREREWAYQSNLAAGEITQIFKQLRASEIREAVAELELRNHRKQIKHAQEIENFLNEEGAIKKGKKTNKALYTWMKREVKGLYSQSFQFAFDISKKAERALQHELGNQELEYIKFGYLSGNEGLLAGEKLHFDLKRMEMAYHELNQREYELTKHVSLLQLNPFSLLQLRTTGKCIVSLPESLFDLDGPGQYFRRIKTISISIPCIAGPYASVNCKLTLIKSSIRKTANLSDSEYAREDSEDNRFDDYFASQQSIVTSSGLNDSGLFETNLHDERYLPFENSGVISKWQLELPANPSKGEPVQFDYNTISDVILHIRYTAREGGGLLRNASINYLKNLISKAKAFGSVRLFSIRQEFTSEWNKFVNQQSNSGNSDEPSYELKFELKKEHYPYWCQDNLEKIFSIEIVAQQSSKDDLKVSLIKEDIEKEDTDKTQTLGKDQRFGNLHFGKLDNNSETLKPTGPQSLFFNKNDIEDLWIAVTYG